MMSEEENTFPVYSPASVIGIFSNALKCNATFNLIYLKGRYAYGAGNLTAISIMTYCSRRATITRLVSGSLHC